MWARGACWSGVRVQVQIRKRPAISTMSIFVITEGAGMEFSHGGHRMRGRVGLPHNASSIV